MNLGKKILFDKPCFKPAETHQWGLGEIPWSGAMDRMIDDPLPWITIGPWRGVYDDNQVWAEQQEAIEYYL